MKIKTFRFALELFQLLAVMIGFIAVLLLCSEGSPNQLLIYVFSFLILLTSIAIYHISANAIAYLEIKDNKRNAERSVFEYAEWKSRQSNKEIDWDRPRSSNTKFRRCI